MATKLDRTAFVTAMSVMVKLASVPLSVSMYSEKMISIGIGEPFVLGLAPLSMTTVGGVLS